MRHEELTRGIFHLINNFGMEEFLWETSRISERLVDMTHDVKYKKQLEVVGKDLKDTFCKVKLIEVED